MTNKIKDIEALWRKLRPRISAPPSVSQVNDLNKLADQLLQESHRFVLMLQKRAPDSNGELVNIAGRQRMLAQRIAKIYVLETWGLTTRSLRAQYNQAVQQFNDGLTALLASPDNSKQIDRELRRVQTNWKIFKLSNYDSEQRQNKYSQNRSYTRVPNLVARSMDRITSQMESITALYAEL
ncbi:MAG: type IV pili methyl-accepting chemotaxis transducer N-terminal domain-containing protein [gamma proteobacterium symbiont of Bathyaustriella thionipta]|nr:type IV pili methyl-accepting chemotaxis transducer N-terminal domain-containing protein [gamma proteobacterium symbiont of Bathyaustriella thionipta]